MSKSLFTEVQSLSAGELVSKKREARQEIFNLRLQQQTGNLEKPSRLRELKRQIARIETAASQQRLGIQSTAKPAAAKTTKTKKAAKA